MKNAKKSLLGLLALITVFGTALPSQAAEIKNQKTATANAPIVFEGDDLSFNEMTGEVFAKGNVTILKGQTSITADELRGNTKASLVWVDGAANLKQPDLNIVGSGVEYNYKDRTGTMSKATGKLEKEYIAAEDLTLRPDQVVLHNGMITMCPAKVPDYRVTADKIELWPGDKLIAHNAKFWIKDKVIFSMPKYQKSLIETTKTVVPRIGYDSDNGFMIAQYLEVPVIGNLAVYGDLAYYTKSDFKPKAGLINRDKNYTASLKWDNEQNEDNVWVKKDQEFELKLNPQRIGNSRLTANLLFSSGKWTEDNISGWRQEFDLYFKHEPIKLSDNFTLKFGTGFQQVKYGYNDSTNNIWKYDFSLHAKPNARLEAWTGYSYKNQSGASVYKYDEIDIPRELTAGVMYRVDKMNGLGLEMSYDLDKDEVHDMDYTWRRNMHCFETDITYRAKREQWTMKVSAIEW
ncbi:LptA/OstA family protein [Dendrosporobacter sp. 1207_IL3150]|uniref:LptA/OstA family protein n=1 Tax=Dendrosporobacter sp. 1207_IL3150 TaxID=3084054 RepID=UPI002FD98473